jgi:hypothetical protein
VTGTSIAPSAGWYADPADAAGQRWWDGVAWTAHVRPVVEAAVIQAPVPVAPVIQAPVPDQPAMPSAPQYPADPQPQFGSLDWRDRAATEASSAGTYAPSYLTEQSLPNHEATRALVSAGFLVGLLVVDLVLRLPGYVRITGIVIAIVLGLLGLRRWRTTGTGLKRSVAGLSIGAVMGLLAIVGVVAVPGFQQTTAYSTQVEQAIVDTSNSVVMPALAVAAACPIRTAVPAVGTVLNCTLNLEDGSRYSVTVTVLSPEGNSSIVIEPPAG